MRLPDVYTGRLLGLKYKLIGCLKMMVHIVGGGIGKFVNNMDGPAFLERELMRLGQGGY